MGAVWRAEHLTLHTEVAVKFVSDALIGDAGFLARFTREAVASARIKSPHAVQVFDHGITADGQPYIVMELLEGEDLRTRLLRERRLSLENSVKVVTQVARGLAKAHAAQIVHRDIKPGNIFLSEQDGDIFVKILDFGIAKQMGDVESQVTMTGQIIGTPHYVSPEQIQRPRDADPQSDLWSLAVVAYRCLTGDLPFEGESVGAVAIAIDKAAYRPVTERFPSLPKRLDEWFQRAFARLPAARFASAKELAVAFDAASKDEPLPSQDVDSASFSNRSLAPVTTRANGSSTDPTPSALAIGGAASKQEERATRPDAALENAPRSAVSTVPDAPQPPQSALETPRKVDTPFTMGEPTLSHGTVTHIELTNPRRTRLYGALIAGVAVAGAVTIALLSRGDDVSGRPATTSPEQAASQIPMPTANSTAIASASATAAATDAAPTSRSSAVPVKSTTSATSGVPPKKKKDRGF